MSRSVKLGIASILLFFGCALPSPLNVASGTISCVLGFLAAIQGSKWWLVVPCAELIFAALIAYVGFRAT
jgi:hypothetical protein